MDKKIKELKKKCGLPDIEETSHCFSDSTHHTCCMLGPKAREYSNKNNPIGKISEDSFYIKNKRKPNSKETTPWCTCFGSKVCSFYANKFNDGTHIKFINDLNSKSDILVNIPKKESCEEWARKSLEINSHKTPGVYESNGIKCTNKDQKQIFRESVYKYQ